MDENIALKINLYRFAQRDWQREQAENFVLTRTLGGRSVNVFLELFHEMQADEQQALINALLKKFHPDAVQALGGAFTSEDQAYWEQLNRRRQRAMLMSYAEIKGPGNRRALNAAVKAELGFLGKAKQLDGPSEWFYTASFGAWKVETWIDMGGRFNDLSYSHDIGRPGQRSTIRHISLLSWLGLSGGSGKLDAESPEEIETSARALARACRLFLDAVPEIVAGID
jgi:hypothetical protein